MHLKQVILGFVELTIGLFFATVDVLGADHYAWFVCTAIFLAAALTSIFPEHFGLASYFFVVIYALQNVTVNLADLTFFRDDHSVYRGDFFSYKLFTLVHVAIASWIYAQTLMPSTAELRDFAGPILRALFTVLVVCSICMTLSVLYELTIFEQHERQAVFLQHLTKTFIFLIVFYLIAAVLSNWLLMQAEYSQQVKSQLVRYESRRRKIEASYERNQDIHKKRRRERELSKPRILPAYSRLNNFKPFYCDPMDLA